MTDIPGTILTAIRDAINAAVLAERERCAKIAEIWTAESYESDPSWEIAAKIRERESESEPFRCPTCGQGQNYAAASEDLIELTPDWHAISKAYIQPAVDALDDMMQQRVVDYVNCLPLSLKDTNGR